MLKLWVIKLKLFKHGNTVVMFFAQIKFNAHQSADEPCVSTEVEVVGCKEGFTNWAVSCHRTDFLLKTKVDFCLCAYSWKEIA